MALKLLYFMMLKFDLRKDKKHKQRYVIFLDCHSDSFWFTGSKNWNLFLHNYYFDLIINIVSLELLQLVLSINYSFGKKYCTLNNELIDLG